MRESWAALEAEGAPDPKTAERFGAAIAAILSLAPVNRDPEPPAPEPETTAITGAAQRLSSLAFWSSSERLEALGDPELESGLDRSRRGMGRTLSSQEAPSQEVQSRFRRSLKSARARLARVLALEAGAREASVLVERAEAASREPDLARAASDLRSLEREWSRLPEPPENQLPERFQAAVAHGKAREEEARAHQEEAEQRTLRDLEARIQLMETLTLSENLSIKDADRVLKEAQDFLKDMGPLPKSANRKKARKRLTDAREQLFKRAQDSRELEEWKRWANVDVQQTLIDRIEKLKDSNDLPKVAKELRQIHEDWKKAGTATPDKAQELWHRYKAIRDEIKARCDAFFEKQNQERIENQKLKEALCVQVESLKDSEDWNKTADEIKEIQIQWKKIGPAPQETSDALWKRFRAACDFSSIGAKRVLDKLKSERDANLAAKVALCERAEAIQDSTDWHQVANELKRMQSEWREVGAVPRKKSDEVWKRFRTACDHFFDRYKRRDEVEVEEKLKKRESLIEELVALGASKSEAGDGLAEKAQAILERLEDRRPRSPRRARRSPAGSRMKWGPSCSGRPLHSPGRSSTPR